MELTHSETVRLQETAAWVRVPMKWLVMAKSVIGNFCTSKRTFGRFLF